MVGNLLIPQNLTDIYELRLKSNLLNQFLTDAANEINNLNSKVNSLEARIQELEESQTNG